MTSDPYSSPCGLQSASINEQGVLSSLAYPMGHRRIVTLLVIYMTYVALFAWAPFTLSLDASDSMGALFRAKFEGISGLTRVTAWDIWSNILFFVPYGLLVALLPILSRRSWWEKTLVAGLMAMLFSGVIEIGQVLLPRFPSVADITWNTVGGLMGGLLGSIADRQLFQDLRTRLRGVPMSAALLVILSGYLSVLPIAFGIPGPLLRDFRTWDPTYHMLLGNEGTMNRAWRGAYYLVAIYDRALRDEEVFQNFAAGSSFSSGQNRVKDGLVSLYDFSEREGDVVHDRAPGQGHVNLRIRDITRVKWLEPNGLMLGDTTVVGSEQPPYKFKGWATAARGTFSVEAWIKPADLSQGGPARIVSYSKDTGHTNFTLGQEKAELVFRLRTPMSGVTGTKPALKTSDQPLQLAVQHLIVTYRSGLETLYINGTVHSTAHQYTLVDLLVRSLGVEFRLVVCSLIMFPLGILSYAICARKTALKAKAVTSFAIALTGLASIGAFCLFVTKVNLDPSFFIVAVATLTISVCAAPQLIKAPSSQCSHT